HAVHAHGVFFRQSRAAEAHRLAADGNVARPRQRDAWFWRLRVEDDIGFSTPHLPRRHPETVAHRVGDGRAQTQAFGCGLAIEPLEYAAQARADPGRRHGQPVALVIRVGLRADLVP